MTIRPFNFSDADYEAMIAVGHANFPSFVETVAECRYSDEHRDAKIQWARFLAESEGTIVGVGSYGQSLDMYHPRKFHLNISVLPQHHGNGIGKALYAHLLAELEPKEPILLRAGTQENQERGVRFLTERGFTEAMRDWESRFDPQSFDPAPFEPIRQKVADSGIVIRSVAELAQSDPDWKRKLYDLDWAITLDMPSTDTLTEPGFEHFEKSTLNNPNFQAESWFVALDGEHWVGESALWTSQGEPVLYVGATGVRQEWRRRGIATALKLAAATFARTAGCPEVRTWNAQQNRAMLSINEAMGFVKQPAWISYEKKLRDE